MGVNSIGKAPESLEVTRRVAMQCWLGTHGALRAVQHLVAGSLVQSPIAGRKGVRNDTAVLPIRILKKIEVILLRVLPPLDELRQRGPLSLSLCKTQKLVRVLERRIFRNAWFECDHRVPQSSTGCQFNSGIVLRSSDRGRYKLRNWRGAYWRFARFVEQRQVLTINTNFVSCRRHGDQDQEGR